MILPATTPTIEQRIPESDVQTHIEDEHCYSAIRDGKIVNGLTWHELDESEQRAAYAATFHPCDYGLY